MQQTIRIILTVLFSIVTCGLVLVALAVARSSWLILGQMYLPSYAALSVADKGLILLGGVVGLGFLIYSLEMFLTSETPIAVLHQFTRLTAPVLWVLGTSHLINALSAMKVGARGAALFYLPIGELLLGVGLYYLRHKVLVAKVTLEESPNLS
ncbi:MAG: hypothetical protein GX316_01075 [Firmicutes bacterium]|nr:hypothetical protein [Bacillota bacterium]